MSVRVISASAGTGKTHQLTEELWTALTERGVRPEGIVAITYTKRAASELESRIRQRLLRQGEATLAARIRDGYLGTIHSVCQRLLREHALELGQSPYLEPLPAGHDDVLFARALGGVTAGREGALAAAARRLDIDDWREPLQRIVKLARENDMDAAALAESGRRSRASLLALLPPVTLSGADYRAAFAAELAPVATNLAQQASPTNAASRERARAAAAAQRTVAEGGLPSWHEQVSLAKELAGKQLQPITGGLLAVIASHLRCDAFQRDLLELQGMLFELAASALDAFSQAKTAAGLIDFGDMLALGARVLREPTVAEALRGELDLVLVDEFQDCSPMQLEFILRLGALAKESVWVGDRKQAIFGFQGSDPELMSAAMAYASGGHPPDVLDRNRRSRPGLVDFHSDVFALALAPHHYTAREVRVAAAFTDPPAIAAQPVLELWTWSSDKQGGVTPKEADAVAAGVIELLAAPPLVRERADVTQTRAARREDVAVLARSNAHCLAIGAALTARGVPVSMALDALAKTPEAVLARAALGLVADPRDGLAAALLSYLGEEAARDPDAWLGRRLEQMREYREQSARDDQAEYPPAFADDPRVATARRLHERTAELSPAEAFALVVRATGLPELVRTWPDPEQRLANLEVLRARAQEYEDLCRVERHPATVLGLAAFLAESRDDEGDRQAMPGTREAVTVITYHRAKGLEWPVVVLTELDKTRPPDPFDPDVVPATEFDAAAPLAGRWVRYWPWPYGGKKKDLALGDVARQSEHGARVSAQSRQEVLRLFYVAFTRARDLLVFAAGVGAKKGPATAALATVCDPSGAALVELPFASSGPAAQVGVQGGRATPCRVRSLSGLPPSGDAGVERPRPWYAGRPPRVAPLELLNPSHTEPARGAGRVVAVSRIAPRPELKVTREPMAAVGNALHAFLAADRGPGSEREVMAQRLLAAHGVASALSPHTLIAAADALRGWLDARYPGARWCREWPVRARVHDDGHERLLRGEIDLVLELDDGYVIVDHKSFPGSDAERDEHVLAYTSQLRWYAEASTRALGKPLKAALIHLPMRGEIVEVEVGTASG